MFLRVSNPGPQNGHLKMSLNSFASGENVAFAILSLCMRLCKHFVMPRIYALVGEFLL